MGREFGEIVISEIGGEEGEGREDERVVYFFESGPFLPLNNNDRFVGNFS